jgi:hypothetical protein
MHDAQAWRRSALAQRPLNAEQRERQREERDREREEREERELLQETQRAAWEEDGTWWWRDLLRHDNDNSIPPKEFEAALKARALHERTARLARASVKREQFQQQQQQQRRGDDSSAGASSSQASSSQAPEPSAGGGGGGGGASSAAVVPSQVLRLSGVGAGAGQQVVSTNADPTLNPRCVLHPNATLRRRKNRGLVANLCVHGWFDVLTPLPPPLHRLAARARRLRDVLRPAAAPSSVRLSQATPSRLSRSHEALLPPPPDNAALDPCMSAGTTCQCKGACKTGSCKCKLNDNPCSHLCHFDSHKSRAKDTRCENCPETLRKEHAARHELFLQNAAAKAAKQTLKKKKVPAATETSQPAAAAAQPSAAEDDAEAPAEEVSLAEFVAAAAAAAAPLVPRPLRTVVPTLAAAMRVVNHYQFGSGAVRHSPAASAPAAAVPSSAATAPAVPSSAAAAAAPVAVAAPAVQQQVAVVPLVAAAGDLPALRIRIRLASAPQTSAASSAGQPQSQPQRAAVSLPAGLAVPSAAAQGSAAPSQP